MDDATIASLSSPPGRGGIAVIRISGDKTLNILGNVIEKLPKKIKPNYLYHSFVVENGHRIDECMVAFFKKPHSYTGEDSAEISVHSNPFIVEKILAVIFSNNSRSAMAGEFTYRAFKNGKIDLMQAESVNEMINANSMYYALMKFNNLEGKLSELINKLKDNLIEIGIKIETVIEFQEDQFMEDIGQMSEIEGAMTIINDILANSRFNEMLNKGLNIVLAGKVNVGKSSLFNHLLMEERSIISSVPGTTRDFINEKTYINGFPFEITDVAGINRGTEDFIEAEGIKRSFEKIKNSDAVIFMVDAERGVDRTDKDIYENIGHKKKIIVINKIDLASEEGIHRIKAGFKNEAVHEISLKNGYNVDVVKEFLKSLVYEIEGKKCDYAVNQRQKGLLTSLLKQLAVVNKMINNVSGNSELIAEEIRTSIRTIGELTGEISREELINGIFAKFCIGK